MSPRKRFTASYRGGLLEQVLDRFKPQAFLGEGVLFKPYIVWDGKITVDGRASARGKLTKVIEVEEPHSLFSYRDFLFFAGKEDGTHKLFIYDGNSRAELAALPTGRRLWYVPINNLMYISNSDWHAIFDFDEFALRPWPEKTDQIPKFHASIVEGEDADFFALPPLDDLCFYQSRLVGSLGNRIIFSEAALFEFTRSFYYLSLPKEITMVAPSTNVLYVGTAECTYVISGPLTNPVYQERPTPAVRGTLCYANIKEGTVPIWASRLALVAGLPGGDIKPLSREFFDMQFDTDGQGAAVYDEHQEEVVTSAPLAPRDARITDHFITEVVRRGSLEKALQRRKDLWDAE